MSELINNRVQITGERSERLAILEEIRGSHPEDEPGHPVHTFKLENQEIAKLIKDHLQVHLAQFEEEVLWKCVQADNAIKLIQ